MNDQQQAELHDLREEQRTLTLRLQTLEERLARFEQSAPLASPLPAASLTSNIPPPLPAALAAREPLSLAEIAAHASPSRVPSLPSQSAALPPPPKPRDSLEMRIGSTWLVYVGVILLLTALAFLGTYLYQNVVPHLGPAGKVALLYLGAGATLGAGAWLERSRQSQHNPRLLRYSRVILAGGLAAVYYVTYAAHYFENLRVIPSSIVAGAALLAWTAFMVFLAHRRDSETLATAGILLAYYTSSINEGVAGFTLFSNLALTAGVVFLLRRHLWRIFPFASLLATFGSYAFWTYYHSALGWRGELGAPLTAQHGPGGFWIESIFLFVYWAMFTGAAFTAKTELLPSSRRASFVSLNNGAFYGLVTWLVLGEGPGGFWKWSLGFGVVLLALSEGAHRLLRPADSRMGGAYLLQGVLLVTTGFVAYFDGWQLSLVLALQSVALLGVAGSRSSRLLLACAALVGLLSFGYANDALHDGADHTPWLSLLAVGGCLLGAATLAQFFQEKSTDAPAASFRAGLAFASPYFGLLGSAVWFWLILSRADLQREAIWYLSGGALALTASVYALRVKSLPIYAQAYLLAGGGAWLFSSYFFSGTAHGEMSGWTTFTLLVTSVALGQWWCRLPGLADQPKTRPSRGVAAFDAILATGVAWSDLTQRLDRWHSSSTALAAGWSVFAAVVFAAGWLLRERIYRWLALLVLAVTLGHIIWFDLTRLDSLGKAVSIFVLAVVILGVSLLYNKFQDKFRDLL